MKLPILVLIALLAIGRTAFAQPQKVKFGSVDFYGTSGISIPDLKNALGIKENSVIMMDKFTSHDLSLRLKTVKSVKRVHIQLACCIQPGNLWMLFAGVSSLPFDNFAFNNHPVGLTKLPLEIESIHDQLNSAVYEGITHNDAAENDSMGHALFHYPPARVCQEKMIGYANDSVKLKLLKKVLRTSKYSDQRAIAAEVIAYAANKKDIIPDLLYALHDVDEDVRNNAARALGIIATYSNLNPSLDLKIPATGFVQLLNSIIWSDRNKALFALMPLTEKRDSALFEELRLQAKPSLIEMAHWKDGGHSYPAYLILGRMAGMPDDQISTAFSSPKKEEFLRQIEDKLY